MGERFDIQSGASHFYFHSGQVWGVKDLMDGELLFLSAGEPFFRDQRNEGDSHIRLAVLGCGGVGKSALSQRFLKNLFVEGHDPTIEDTYRKTIVIDGKVECVEVLDTAGQEEFSSFRHQWMHQKDGYIFVYSMTDRASFDHLDQYAQLHYMLNGSKGQTPPIYLVANKADLKEDQQVSEEEALEALSRWREMFLGTEAVVGTMRYVEASAKTGRNVHEMFIKLARDARQRISRESNTGKSRPRQQCGFFPSIFWC